ncbi:HEAT repeat domain-containing protein, partial [bacterium]
MEADDRLLPEARQQLRAALRVERSHPSLLARVREYFDWMPAWNYRVFLGGAAMLAGGILIGRTFLSPSYPVLSTQPRVQPIAVGSAPAVEEPRIMNLQFNQAGTGNGEVDFTFDAVTPVHLKGNINDEKIQAVLAHALLTEQNPGVRLRSVNMLASQTEQLRPPDPKVKGALVSALRSDENPAVRREALR